MFTLIFLMFKLCFWLAVLPFQIMLLPLTILAGGSKSKSSEKRDRNDSMADDLFVSGVVMNELLDDLEEDDWWRD